MFFQTQMVEDRGQNLWGSHYSEHSSAHKKPYDYNELVVPDPPLGRSEFYEHRPRSEQYKRKNLASDPQLAADEDKQEYYRSQTGADDFEVVEALLSFSKLGASGWNNQSCHTAALELPPSPPSSQGGVSPHHPLESDVEETCDALNLRRRPSKDPEFGKVRACFSSQ